MYLTVLGPQGSGKSTQAKLLSEYLNIPYFSTGEEIRKILSDKNHELYSLINDDYTKGKLLSNVIINKILNLAIERTLHDGSNGLIIDGTPRKLNQMQDIDEILALHTQKLDLVIFIDVSIEECKARILSRVEKEHRVDDTPTAVQNRLNTYFSETLPIIAEYEKRGILYKIDGNRPIEPIFEDIKKINPLLKIKL
ncbi:nucleoside monophosphate kinase [Patescibacteria group bacterium]|nr:nucleoside monophosphate kinase [Patescibacteria group bacterium]